MGVNIQIRPAALILAICLVILASCGGSVILHSTLYCQLSDSTAQFTIKLPGNTPFGTDMQQAMQHMLTGSQEIADVSVRQLVVKYLLYVTEAANSGGGRLTEITKPEGKKLWAPTRYFTRDAVNRSYSVAGYSMPLFSLDSRADIANPIRIEYAEFRAAALEWLSSGSTN